MSPARVVDLYLEARSAISRYGDAVAARTRALCTTYLDDSDTYRRLEAEERAIHAELVRVLRSLCAEAGCDIDAYERALAETVARTVARLGDLGEEDR